MSDATDRVVVVGGGVIGATCAYYLRRSGHPVLILDADQFGQGCSHANCGLICPSHVLPLAEPGAVMKTLRHLVTPNAPFSIKLRWDPALWLWFYRFGRRCNINDMLAAGRARHALLESSSALYRELIATERIECEWQTRGMLCAFRSPKAMNQHAEACELLAERFGVQTVHYDGDALVALEPALKPGLAGGWCFESDSHLRPDRLMAGWRNVLEREGVKILEHCELTAFVRDQNGACAVQTAHRSIPGKHFVVATGAWTRRIEKQLGCSIPIQPGKGYSITTPRPAQCPTIPLIFPETKVVATPFESGYRLGSMMEFAGYDSSIPPRRLSLLERGAEPYLDEPIGRPIQETWQGWRPMTYDGIPIIDQVPTMPNVYVAAGHNMLGLSMAPATGRLITELIDGTKPHIDPKPYAFARFI